MLHLTPLHQRCGRVGVTTMDTQPLSQLAQYRSIKTAAYRTKVSEDYLAPPSSASLWCLPWWSVLVLILPDSMKQSRCVISRWIGVCSVQQSLDSDTGGQPELPNLSAILSNRSLSISATFVLFLVISNWTDAFTDRHLCALIYSILRSSSGDGGFNGCTDCRLL